MKKKLISTAIIIALIFLLLLYCILTEKKNPNQSSGEKVVLNEVAHSIFYAPLYVAIENGYFAEEGIDLSLVTGFGADKTMTALLTGEADIGFMGSESSIYTYLGGASDYPVNFAQLTQRAGNFLVSRTPVDHFEWSMLQGKNVLGGRKGGMPEMVFEFILKKNNMDPTTDLHIDQSIDFGSTAAAFSGGQGDFSVEFEPHATALEKKGDGYIVASLGVDSGYVPYTAFCAKRSYMDAHPKLIEAFVRALRKGMEYTDSHSSDELAVIIAPQFKETDVNTIATIIERYKSQNTWKSDLVFEESSFTLLQNILEEAGELSERVPYEKLVTNQFTK